jgi:hypothetical protein
VVLSWDVLPFPVLVVVRNALLGFPCVCDVVPVVVPGDREGIFLLARAGTDLSEKDANGMDALLYALSYGDMNHQDARIAVALVRAGANTFNCLYDDRCRQPD